MKALQADEDGPPPTARPRAKTSNRPRQPVDKNYKNVVSTFGVRFLEDKPDCAVVVARCVASWTYVEMAFALLLASLIKIGTEPAVAIYRSIQNSRIQQQVLVAAAETVLKAKDFELLEAIVNIAASIEKDRNDLVHGVYGGAMQVPHGLLWASQKDYLNHTVDVWASDYKNLDNSSLKLKTFVYEPEDLETIAQKIEWLQFFIHSFRGYCSAENDVWRAERYPQLCAEPLLATELRRMREGQKRTPTPPRKPGQKGRRK